jgi:hypothetical protein
METKPGARPHCGAKAVSAPFGQRAHGLGRGDVLRQVEIMRAGAFRGAGDGLGEKERRGGESRLLVRKGCDQRILVGHVDHLGGDPRPGGIRQRCGVAVGDGDGIVARIGEHRGQQRARSCLRQRSVPAMCS